MIITYKELGFEKKQGISIKSQIALILNCNNTLFNEAESI